MSNSGSSSLVSSGRPRGRIVGVSKRCWCGSSIIAISKSVPNPSDDKLSNDDHKFKWLDAALLEEIEAVQVKNVRFEKELKEIFKEREEFERKIVVLIGCMIMIGLSKLVG